jgi:tetratricopeptide (TPR) repeat protein
MNSMPRHSFICFVILSFLLMSPAQAADPAGCVKDAKGETAVSDCTASIESGKLKGWELAASYVNRAIALTELGKLDEAMADLQKAMALRSPYPDALFAQAKLKVKLKERDAAIAALAADPRDCNADADAEVAISACTKAIAKGDLKGADLAEAYLRRGSGYDYLGKYDEAGADLDQSVKTDPDFSRGYMWRGYFKMKMHKEDVALADFNKAVSLKPDSAEALAFRARYYYEARGDWKGVIADMEMAVKLDPDNEDFATYLENAQNEQGKQ